MTPRHHTVPQMYLRNFADSSNQVMLVSRDDQRLAHRSTVKNAIAEVGFYRIESTDLAREEDRASFDPEGIEQGLSQIESAAAPTLEEIVREGMVNFDDWNWYRLFQFIAVQTARGRRWREDVSALLTQSVRVEYLSELANGGARDELVSQRKAPAPADVSAYLVAATRSNFPRVIPPQAVLVQESLRMALGTDGPGDIGLVRFLAGRRVRVVRPAETAVLTSDEPVCWWSPGDSPVGYATAQVVWLPLSPRLIVQLCAPEFDEVGHGFTNDEEIARFANAQVADHAERWIIHHPSDSPLDGLDLPPREVWGDELVGIEEDGETRREVWVHRRLRPRAT